MISVGIDVGAKNINIVVLRFGELIAKGMADSGFEARDNALRLLGEVLAECDLAKDDLDSITSTGSGRKDIDFANHSITDVTAATKGTITLHPEVRTIIDVGAEEGRGIRLDDNGKIVDFAVNEKCAAGSGAFVESMSRALELTIEDFGPLSLESDKEIPMNAQCAVFAESEVISLVHSSTEKKDIAKAITDAIAARVSSMVRKVGFQTEIAVIGGVAYNVGFIRSIQNYLEKDVLIPESPEYVSAFGAALLPGK